MRGQNTWGGSETFGTLLMTPWDALSTLWSALERFGTLWESGGFARHPNLGDLRTRSGGSADQVQGVCGPSPGGLRAIQIWGICGPGPGGLRTKSGGSADQVRGVCEPSKFGGSADQVRGVCGPSPGGLRTRSGVSARSQDFPSKHLCSVLGPSRMLLIGALWL